MNELDTEKKETIGWNRVLHLIIIYIDEIPTGSPSVGGLVLYVGRVR